jgi:flagellar basal body-associated protein FliL
MDDDKKQELVKKLSESRENIVILQNMLNRELSNLEHELRLVDDAKRNLNDVLYELTGSDFYRNK